MKCAGTSEWAKGYRTIESDNPGIAGRELADGFSRNPEVELLEVK
jgi:hypothetical protein